MTRTHYNSRDSIVSEFLTNPREGIRYARGRMYVRESPDGSGFQLIAYGDQIVAEVDKSLDEVTFYTGHHGQVSRTLTGYIKRFGSVLSNTQGFEVDIRSEAPTNGYVRRNLNATAAQFINNYVGGFSDSDFSPVEQDAIDTVEDALAEILAVEFGEE